MSDSRKLSFRIRTPVSQRLVLGMTVANSSGRSTTTCSSRSCCCSASTTRSAAGRTASPGRRVVRAAVRAVLGLRGFLSDKFDKRSVCGDVQAGEIAIMAIGTFVVAREWLPGALAILFLMGTHSAFFGPSKYGILPSWCPLAIAPRQRVVPDDDLPRDHPRNRAGGLLNSILPTMPWACGRGVHGGSARRHVGGGGSSVPSLLRLRVQSSTAVAVRLRPETRRLILSDPLLRTALLVSSLFWFCGGVVQPTVNAVGKLHVFAGLPTREGHPHQPVGLLSGDRHRPRLSLPGPRRAGVPTSG